MSELFSRRDHMGVLNAGSFGVSSVTNSLSDVHSSFPEPTTGEGSRSPTPGLTAAFDPGRFHDGAVDIVSRLTTYLGDRSVRGSTSSIRRCC